MTEQGAKHRAAHKTWIIVGVVGWVLVVAMRWFWPRVEAGLIGPPSAVLFVAAVGAAYHHGWLRRDGGKP